MVLRGGKPQVRVLLEGRRESESVLDIMLAGPEAILQRICLCALQVASVARSNCGGVR